jgi:YihY family inner membrane protein
MVTAMGLIAGVGASAASAGAAALPAAGPGSTIAALGPYALVCVGFALVYWLVPNTAVRPRAALVGGAVGGVLWAGTGALFAAFVVDSATTLSIYATFAIAITALFWLYLCWHILLVGALNRRLEAGVEAALGEETLGSVLGQDDAGPR